MPLLYNPACLYRSLPLPEGKPERFSRLQVFGAGTLPVGFQGRSALVAEGEIPERRYFRKSSITGTSVPCGSSTGSSSVSALSGVALLRLE